MLHTCSAGSKASLSSNASRLTGEDSERVTNPKIHNKYHVDCLIVTKTKK